MNLSYSNFAVSTLAEDFSQWATQAVISDPGLFPSGSFTAVIWDGAKASPLDDPAREIVTLTLAEEPVYNVLRGESGTSPAPWQTGSKIANIVTAEAMEFLFSAALSSGSYDITENIFSMDRYSTNVFLIYADTEAYKAVTLPEAALVTGNRTFTITNRGSRPAQSAKIFPYTGDSFTHTANPHIVLPSGASVTLCVTEGGWYIRDYSAGRMNGIKKVDAYSPQVSFGDGTIFADTSAGAMGISLPTDEGLYGTPLTIVKYDSLDKYVFVEPFTESPGSEMIYGQFESLTFMAEADGSVRLISRYTPENIKTRIVTSNCTLRGQERVVLADASASGMSVTLPHADRAVGKRVTVKKTDSSANTVLIRAVPGSIDGEPTYTLASQSEYATFASSGQDWYRIG